MREFLVKYSIGHKYNPSRQPKNSSQHKAYRDRSPLLVVPSAQKREITACVNKR